MSSSHIQAHRDRIKAEVNLLHLLVSENPGSLKIEHEDTDTITLRLIVGSYVVKDPRSTQLDIASEHTAHITFLDSDEVNVLFEIRLEPILFHPNIRPGGQWQVNFSHVVDYLYRLWEYYTYGLVIESADRIHNTRALDWYKTTKPTPPSQKVLRRVVSPPSEQELAARAIAPSEQVIQRPGGEGDENRRPEEHEPAQPVSESVSQQARRPVEVAGADGRGQSSGFRVKSRIRVPQPRQLRFPRELWENGTRANYKRWWYDVPPPYQAIESPRRLKVVILEKALRSILQHAIGDTRNERFGILVGGLYQDPESKQQWVEIVAMLPAERVRANIAFVEVSTEEINRLNNSVDVILAETQETVRKIGWYHTHPGHGIFLSSTDQNNQRLCYGADWQVAMVVDPVRKRYGAFHSSECTPLFDGMLVPSEQEAQHLQTPAYLAWKDLEEREIVRSSSERPSSERDSVVPQPVEHNQQQVPVRVEVHAIAPPLQTDRQQEAPSPLSPLPRSDEQSVAMPLKPQSNEPQVIPPPQRGDEQPALPPQRSEGQKDALQPLGSMWRKLLEGIGKATSNPPIVALLLVLMLGILFWLLFSLVRSNGALADVQSRSGQQVKTAQQQLQTTQAQLQKSQQQLQQIQQNLFTQISGSNLKKTDPLMYRKLLKTVVGINPNTDSGKKAANALKDPLFYTVVQGDTLETIAKKFEVSVKALQDANPNVKPESLQPDTVLKIPGITV